MTEPQNPTPETPPENPTPEERTFSQKDVDKIAGNRAKEAAKTAEAAAYQKLLKDVGAESLDELREGYQGFKTVEEETQSEAEKARQEAEKAQGKVKELEPYKDKAERYEEVLKKDLEKRMEGIPDHIKSLLGGMDPVDQHAWLTDNQEALGTQVTPLPTTPEGDKTEPKGVAKSYMDKKYGTQAS